MSKELKKLISKQFRRYQWIVLTVLTITLCLFTHSFPFFGENLGEIGGQSNRLYGGVLAQTLTPEVVSEEVYKKIPDFPLENNYINIESQQVASENTLITRVVRYHQYIKSRPTIYRLDWKLTLADYLGKNEIIDENRYPNTTLTENPLEKDKKIIQSLTRQQRDELVNVLVNIYNPQVDSNNTPKLPQNQETKPTNNSPSFQLPRQGGADLLLTPIQN